MALQEVAEKVVCCDRLAGALGPVARGRAGWGARACGLGSFGESPLRDCTRAEGGLTLWASEPGVGARCLAAHAGAGYVPRFRYNLAFCALEYGPDLLPHIDTKKWLSAVT